MAVKNSKRIFYFDALRALAILAVVLIHAFGRSSWNIILANYGVIPSFNWFLAAFDNNCLRIGVCLFLMLSGALSLGRSWDIKSFLGKRIPRIVGPFLFWGFVISVSVLLLAPYLPFEVVPSFDFNTVIMFIYNNFMSNSTRFTYQYWFFWMILGTYLIMPVFNKWILHSSLSELEYFLVIWLITCLFDFTLGVEFPIKLTYFVSPIGLVVAGYYLRYTERDILNNPYFDLGVIVLSMISLLIIAYLNSTPESLFKMDRYSIFIAFEVMGIFLLFKNFSKFGIDLHIADNPDNIVHKIVFSLAKYSYGIYLSHSVFLTCLGIILYDWGTMHYKLFVFILFVVPLCCSWGLLIILNRIPHVNKIIGAK